jgi:hypothetical protein
MKAISESCLQNRLDSGSTKRYSEYQARLRKDSTQRIFDDRAVRVLKQYAFNPEQIDDELEYLKHLKNDEGELFCRSMGKYTDMEKQYTNFQAPEKDSFRWNRHYKAAVAIVSARYAQAKLKALEYQSDEDIYNAVTDWSTATGWTSIQTGLRKKVDVLDGVFLVYQSREQEAKAKGSFETPIVCGTRTQGSGAYDEKGKRTGTWKSKKRAVFMVDVYTIIAESKFGSPLNDWLKDYSYTAIGKDDRWLTSYVGTCRNNGMNFISLDYSKYDSTIPSWLIHSAFDVIRAAFSEYDSTLLAVIEEDFINKNIITGTGLIHVTHGNPSGSRLTAIINGICNEIMTETWKQALNLRGVCNIMGDDNLVYLDGIHKVDDALVSSISQYITHNFGIVVNADKSNYGSWRDDPEYLSRFWGFSGPYRSVGEVISLIAYPEKFRPYNRKDVMLSPEMIIYSYVLAYRRTMETLIDVERFLRDVNLSYAKIEWTKEQREAVPYNIRLSVELKNQYQRASLRAMLEANALARARVAG